MEKISIEEIKRLASLSSIEFSEEELASFTDEFSNILELVEKVKNSDIGDAEIKYTCHDMSELREDEVKPSFTQEEVLLNSPKTKKNSFCVPKMLEG